MNAYFISDIHIRNSEDPNSRILSEFLNQVRDSASHVFMLGDIFDIWVGEHNYFIKSHKMVVDAIRNLVEAGVRVHYVEGNHDFHLKGFWSDQMKVQVHERIGYAELGRFKIRFEHGDFINMDDKAYLRLRAFLRSLPMRTISRKLPGGVVSAIGEWSSRQSSQFSREFNPERREQLRELIHKYAQHMAHEDDFDFLITGHLHVKDDYSFNLDGRQVRSVNLGHWGEPKAFQISDEKQEFVALL